jgi:F-type H+-transporting ATPase subunit delta
MANASIARRYAKALVALGQDEGNIADQLTNELEDVVNTLLSHDGQLFDALCHPALALVERQALLNTLMPKLKVHGLLQNFLRLLLEKQRFSFLPAISADARSQADVIAGRARATVTTATPMTASMEKEVQTTLQQATGKTIILDTKVDASLIGGMIAQVGGKVFDASVKTRLAELRQQLLDSNPTSPVGDA